MSIKEIIEKNIIAKKNAARKKTAKKVAIGAGIGTAIGLAAGVLLTPKAGKETRDDIAKNAKKAVKSIKEKLNEAVEKHTAKGEKSGDDTNVQ